MATSRGVGGRGRFQGLGAAVAVWNVDSAEDKGGVARVCSGRVLIVERTAGAVGGWVWTGAVGGWVWCGVIVGGWVWCGGRAV